MCRSTLRRRTSTGKKCAVTNLITRAEPANAPLGLLARADWRECRPESTQPNVSLSSKRTCETLV